MLLVYVAAPCALRRRPNDTTGVSYVTRRIFHLVYGRSKQENAGGPGHDGPDHLEHQVLNLATDLRRITERFVNCVESKYRGLVQAALDDALIEAKKTADSYGIPDPL